MNVGLKDRVRFQTETQTVEGTVDQVQRLTDRVRVKTEDGSHYLVDVSELEILEKVEQ